MAQTPGMGAKAKTQLPPAGHARNEELRQRADKLIEKAERLHAEQGGGAIDPAALEIDPEIAAHFDELHVSEALPEYLYLWENFVSHNGYAIRSRLAIRVKLPNVSYMTPAWEIVKGDMPEAEELRQVDGTRKLGDAMLMRCRRDVYRIIQRARRRRVAMMDAAVDTRLQEMADDIGHKYVRVHREMDMGHPAMKHAAAASIARTQLMKQIAAGDVDGLDVEDAA
jgi:hypothetical protein